MPSFFRSAEVLMVQYAHYHRDRRNIVTHFVGIPLIFLAIGVLLASPVWSVPGVALTPAWLMWGITSVWYLTRGNWLLGLATCVVNGALIALAHLMLAKPLPWGMVAWQLGVALFVVGWMFVVGEAVMALGLLGGLHRAIERQAGPVR